MSKRYLSKSRFKEALECLTKLYYTKKEDEYANQQIDDPFLQALADGGHQVGMLAIYLCSQDPVSEGILVSETDYDKSLKDTTERFNQPGKVTIAEAAFRYDHLFIRADIIVKEKQTINLYEVKSKSIDLDDGGDFDDDHVDDKSSFYSYLGSKRECIKSKWVPYLYDLAFQKYVISKTHPEYQVKAHLVLADKNAKASIDGLNQLFQLQKKGKYTEVIVPDGLTADQLGNPLLRIINLDDVVEKIWHTYNVPNNFDSELDFERFVWLCQDIYKEDKRVQAPLTSKCSKCAYFVKTETGKKDGRKECLSRHAQISPDQIKNAVAYELWWGGRAVDKVLANNVFFLKDILPEDITPKSRKSKEATGLDSTERKLLQIEKEKAGDDSYYFDRDSFLEEAREWKYPLHMIDFETSQVALPFFRDTSSYQGHAFQFSHHKIHEDGRIEHASEFIHFKKNEYPNLAFIRALRESLSADEGSVFRYHNHENTYLRLIHEQILSGEIKMDAGEKKEILAFIDHITRHKPDPNDRDYISGNRAMIDLYELVKRFYYPPSAGGKIGLKHILPAIIRDSDYLRGKYSRKGIYGRNLAIKSLNFEDHQWIDPRFGLDPYLTLPPVHTGELQINAPGSSLRVADGGAALTAYNYLQYTQISDEERLLYRDALLRYCELDTMAMVFILEGLMQLEGHAS